MSIQVKFMIVTAVLVVILYDYLGIINLREN
jgi:hypothetical protein